jgi:Bacterial SH3 domain
MKRIVSALLVLALCLLVGVGSLAAQQATVNHGVSLRGDPSIKNPSIGHLNRNSTVTLLASKPKTGFYHVKTSDGTEGWVGIKYLTVEGQAGAQPTPSPTPSASTTPIAGSTGCDQSLWNHVYHGTFATAKDRLKILKPCTTVTGIIMTASPEADGDYHVRLKLDPNFENLLNAKNKSGQHGYLVIEPICEKLPTQPDTVAEGVCNGFQQTIFKNTNVGKHVRVTGDYVQDMEHGWMEIHPVTSIQVIQ